MVLSFLKRYFKGGNQHNEAIQRALNAIKIANSTRLKQLENSLRSVNSTNIRNQIAKRRRVLQGLQKRIEQIKNSTNTKEKKIQNLKNILKNLNTYEGVNNIIQLATKELHLLRVLEIASNNLTAPRIFPKMTRGPGTSTLSENAAQLFTRAQTQEEKMRAMLKVKKERAEQFVRRNGAFSMQPSNAPRPTTASNLRPVRPIGLSTTAFEHLINKALTYQNLNSILNKLKGREDEQKLKNRINARKKAISNQLHGQTNNTLKKNGKNRREVLLSQRIKNAKTTNELNRISGELTNTNTNLIEMVRTRKINILTKSLGTRWGGPEGH